MPDMTPERVIDAVKSLIYAIDHHLDSEVPLWLALELCELRREWRKVEDGE